MNKKLLIFSLFFSCVMFQQNFLFSAPGTSEATEILSQIKNYFQNIEFKQNAEKTFDFAMAHKGGTVGVGLFTIATLITLELVARKVIKSRGRDVGILWDVVRACLFPITPHHIEIIFAHKKLALEVFALYGMITAGTISTVLSGLNTGIRTDYVVDSDFERNISIKKILEKINKMHLKTL